MLAWCLCRLTVSEGNLSFDNANPTGSIGIQKDWIIGELNLSGMCNIVRHLLKEIAEISHSFSV